MEAQVIPGGAARTRPGLRLEKPTRLFVVDDTPSPCRFSASIQAAVDAADEGDVILVKAGAYASFTVDGKSVCVIGEGGPMVASAVRVRNLQADQSVVLRGFSQISLPSLTNNSGPVWVEGCLASIEMTSSDSTVGFFRCRTENLSASNSTVIAYHSTLQGANGRDAHVFDCSSCIYTDAEPGTAGLSVRDGAAFLFGSSVQGGQGGAEYRPDDCGFCETCLGFCGFLPPGCGGDALELVRSSSTQLETELVFGFEGFGYGGSGCDGEAVSGGTPTTLPGKTGEFSVDSPVSAGSPLHYKFEGPPGWRVFVTYASEYTPVFDPTFRGMSVVPLDSPTVFVGTLPASGLLEVIQPAGNLFELGSAARVFYMQAKLYDPSSGIGVLGTPSALVVIRDPCL
jgi:hypothetical protein